MEAALASAPLRRQANPAAILSCWVRHKSGAVAAAPLGGERVDRHGHSPQPLRAASAAANLLSKESNLLACAQVGDRVRRGVLQHGRQRCQISPLTHRRLHRHPDVLQGGHQPMLLLCLRGGLRGVLLRANVHLVSDNPSGNLGVGHTPPLQPAGQRSKKWNMCTHGLPPHREDEHLSDKIRRLLQRDVVVELPCEGLPPVLIDRVRDGDVPAGGGGGDAFRADPAARRLSRG